jgi:cysteine-S-conjugate beta-lyase
MPFDFDKNSNREGTNSTKYDGRQAYFGRPDVNPLWVADMDFAVPESVTAALQKRIEHPVLGYSFYPESLYQSLIYWTAKRHGWIIERDWIVFVPGVVPSLFATVLALTQESDGVIVQSPVYFPFFSAVTTNKRKLLVNPLKLIGKQYQMDIEHLEHCAQQGAKLLMLCSPHNPVGRVWTQTELEQVLTIARRYNLTILSDDIHCDLVYSGNKHFMLSSIAQPNDNIITTIAPNKTFNIPGLGLSAMIIPNEAQRKAIKQVFDGLHVTNHNPLSIVAFEAAYNGGEDWLNALMKYLEKTRDFVIDYCTEHISSINIIKPEATFLLWLDCRKMNLSDTELRDFFVNQCKIGLNPGIVFGEGGSGFMRMNIGTPRANIESALSIIRDKLSG